LATLRPELERLAKERRYLSAPVTQGERYLIIRDKAISCLPYPPDGPAFLAGFLPKDANEEFRPEPFESFCLATSEHDNGWAEWSCGRRWTEKFAHAVFVMSIPTDEHIALYQRESSVW